MTRTAGLVAGITLLLAAAAGWFVLSWKVMGTPAGDAVGEAIGVAFALLIVVSVVGAVRGRRR
jgi:hypothetical protein